MSSGRHICDFNNFTRRWPEFQNKENIEKLYAEFIDGVILRRGFCGEDRAVMQALCILHPPKQVLFDAVFYPDLDFSELMLLMQSLPKHDASIFLIYESMSVAPIIGASVRRMRASPPQHKYSCERKRYLPDPLSREVNLDDEDLELVATAVRPYLGNLASEKIAERAVKAIDSLLSQLHHSGAHDRRLYCAFVLDESGVLPFRFSFGRPRKRASLAETLRYAPLAPETVNMVDDAFCEECSWPVLHFTCTGKFAMISPYKEWSNWAYCTNKICIHHGGEGFGMFEPAFYCK